MVLGAGAVGAASALDGFVLEPRWLDVTHHEVQIDGLPAALDGYRIAQVTDVHLTSLGGLHEKLVEAIDRADPQLVAITGDLIDNRTDLADADELCRQISRSGRNVVATLGNWEHRSDHDIEDVAKLYKTCDIELLVNESMQLDDGLIVAGTDDGATGRADLPATVRALPDGDVKLLLTHAPGLLDVLLDVGTTFDLTLSGHTHGGQVKFGPFAPMRPAGSGPFVAGMYDTNIGPAYVSRGVGTTLLPVRFFCRPELAIFELRR